MTNRSVIVALDFSAPDQALKFVQQLNPDQCAVKVGFELFVAGGPQLVERLIGSRFKVFLDLKFHDIPNTVAMACAAAARLGVWMINVHASGGVNMLSAARESIDNFASDDKPILLAVTVLTSLDQVSLNEIGITQELSSVVKKWAAMSDECGLDGVVCSAREAKLVKAISRENFEIVTPGIRLPDNSRDDQQRIVTPTDARKAGATRIVVGRPITQARDPGAALEGFYTAFVGA